MAETKDQYMGLLMDGASPFNGRPSTHFRQAILGVMKEPFCFEPGEIESPEDVEILSPLPIQPRIPFECPEDTEHKITVKATLPFELERDKVKGYKLTGVKYISEDSDVFIKEGEKFAALDEGEYILTVVETYEGSLTCEHVYEIKVTKPPKDDDSEEDEDEDETPPASGGDYVPGF